MKVSIITPSFKQLDWLRLCVASVADQKFNDQIPSSKKITSCPLPRVPCPVSVEHIIQDAGSPGIEEFARELGADFYQDGQLLFSSSKNQEPACDALRGGSRNLAPYTLKIFSEKDAGMYDAINKGLLLASGDLLAYLNCDEQYLPGTLEKVISVFRKKTGIEILFGDTIVVNAHGGYICSRRVVIPQKLHTLVSGNLSVFTSSTFFLRSIIEKKLLFSRAWKAVGDSIWMLSLIKAGCKMTTLPDYLSIHTDMDSNMIKSPLALKEKIRLFCMASSWMQKFKPLILMHYRLRRLLAGAYHLPPHAYSIYTQNYELKRRWFAVIQPHFRWLER
jgi:glycosyltransferase involved in cell wall biosynthesis